MKLIHKVSLLIAALMIGLIATNFVVIKSTVMPTFELLERQSAEKDMERIAQALDREADFLKGLSQDWAFWTDTRDFVLKRDQTYVGDNLMDATFTGLKTEAFFIIDLEGRIRWGTTLDLEEVELLNIPSLPHSGNWNDRSLLHAADADKNSTRTGLIRTELGLMVVAAAPILTSESKGPSVGTLIFGRLLNDKKLEQLRAQIGVSFEVLPADHRVSATSGSGDLAGAPNGTTFLVDDTANGTLNSYRTFTDINGKPLAVIKAVTLKDITKTGKQTLLVTLLLLAAGGTWLVILLSVLLKKVAIDPIRQLTEIAVAVGETGDLTQRSNIQKDDEIGVLSIRFDSMLGELQEAREVLREQSYYTGVLEMSAGLIHNLRNTINPISVNAWKSLQVLDKSRLANFYKAVDALADPATDPEKRDAYLAYIKGASQSITDERELLHERISEIAAETKHVEGILNEHNRLNRPEMCVESVDLKPVIERAVKQVPIADDVLFDIVVPDDLPRVSSNHLLLSQVIGNLMVNAHEAIAVSDQPSGRIELSIETITSDSGPRLTIIIRDNGEGISEEIRTRLFERGFSTRKEKSGGLGLHWCANTLRVMGGSLRLDSDGVGQGAVAHIELAAINTIESEAA